MRYRNELSVLGLGCMRFPRGIAGIDMRKSEELVMRAIAGGINYFDTAWIYPGSEEALGAIVEKNHVRDSIYIATKLPIMMAKGPADFDKYFNQALKRLRTDYIDYYLMHMVTSYDEWLNLKSWGIENWLAEKKKSGHIRHIGFSYHGSCDEFLKVLNDYDWEMCMIQYNYSDAHYQAGVTGLKEAAKKMPVMIMEPLLGGRLATGLPAQAVEIFKKANPDLSPAAWALNWLWNQPEVTLTLSGMSTIEQLEENLALAEAARPGMLGEAEHDVYRRALEVIKKSNKISCTGCNYCMPCPKGVNIPGCFATYNTLHSIGYVAGMKQFVQSTGLLSEWSSSPSLCVKCGKCETHCPQKLPVMKHLAQVQRRMEPLWFRALGVCARAVLGKRRKK